MEILTKIIRPELYVGLPPEDRIKYQRSHYKSYLYVVLNTVCSVFSVRVEDVLGKSRTTNLTIPRFMAMKILYDSGIYTLKELGVIFSNRDHSTIVYGKSAFDDLHTTDKYFREKYNQVMTILNK